MSNIPESEKIAKQYYEEKGYEVINLETNKNTLERLPKSQALLLNQEVGEKALSQRGLPDLCLIDDEGIEFIEVKREGEKVSQEQLDWGNNHDQKFSVVIVDTDAKLVTGKKVYNREQFDSLTGSSDEIDDVDEYLEKLVRQKAKEISGA